MPKPLQHEDRIQLALEALRSGQIKIIRKAADAFGVPKSTLHRRVKGGGTRQEAQVKNRKLRPTEEAALIQWIESLDDRGMSPTIGYIRQMADLLLRERGGFTLLNGFFTSTPVPAMTVQSTTINGPYAEDPEKISAWFARVQRTINEYGVLDSDIYNFDETGFQMGVASTSKVVTRSDRRNRPVVIQPGNREWTTVIECINASGWSVDPMIIFEGKVHISSWYDGSVLPKTWRIGVSDNGWTTDELTFEWLREVFEPQTRKRTVGRYRLLILDGHGSHSTPAFDKFCTEHRILTECMPPHSSHYLQPLDVSCFAVLKRTYGDLVKAKIALGVHHIDKPRFLELFLEARKRHSIQRTSQAALELQGSCLSIQLRRDYDDWRRDDTSRPPRMLVRRVKKARKLVERSKKESKAIRFQLISRGYRNKQALEALLEEAQYDLMAIQEPWINQQTKSTYCPRGSKYHLVHKASGRAAIFVSRKFDTGQWEYETSKEHCKGAQRGRTSTIDHFWASVGLQTTYYGLEYRGKSDHYPQILEADIGGPLPQQTQPGGWNWKMMDRRRVEAEAALLPEKIGLEDPGPQGLRAQVREQEGLKEAFNWLVEELQRIAEVATPSEEGQQRPRLAVVVSGGPRRPRERQGEPKGSARQPRRSTTKKDLTKVYGPSRPPSTKRKRRPGGQQCRKPPTKPTCYGA
ncbi:hypothetical protein CHGG_02703 [Chaetomium globosum CBS 148.51]|uniref:HTH CENPB-type domain-containing protein n=1 Tax=Chaetomium globosum (strain ATCC 6205 / CBS 148.51 / DSM 1962 / NBRC 6347 / NRRL 1970) TaxID=306901 RepID=Q2HAQ1_CHAGB|nr:uncharacterized protein CHGG_02703 [Chaetomium globosum CBS 148.51]EAQ90768.1 hypothetical protein CHGG_02703 [Chaetomium globosum CBS 148.51]